MSEQQQEWITKIDKELERMSISQLKTIFNNLTRGKQEAKREGKKIRRRRNLDILSKDEIISLLDASTGNLRDNLVLLLFIKTGATLAELYGSKNKTTGAWEHGVQVKNVDFRKKEMWVYIRQRRNPVKRAIQIDDPGLVKLLRQYIEQNELFNSKYYIFRDTMSYWALQQIPRLNATRAKIRKDVSPQSLRNFFIVSLLREGESLEYVQFRAGHRDLSATQLYLKYL